MGGAKRKQGELLAADFAEDILGDVDGNIGGNGQGDGVAGPAVDLDELPIDADAELGEIGVIAQLADENVLQVAAHAVNDAGDKIMSQGPGRRHFFDAAVDAGRLENADHDG